jgi:hypothetical protein
VLTTSSFKYLMGVKYTPEIPKSAEQSFSVILCPHWQPHHFQSQLNLSLEMEPKSSLVSANFQTTDSKCVVFIFYFPGFIKAYVHVYT